MYTSSDGGLTWADEQIYQAEENINYIDGYAPAFCDVDKNQGMLILKVVGEDTDWQMYVTKDGGSSWTEEGKVPCESVNGYAYISENSFLIIDGVGKLYKNK